MYEGEPVETVRVEDILWDVSRDDPWVLPTNLLGEVEARALYEAMKGWVQDDGMAPIHRLDFNWPSAFYSVEFFARLFDLCQMDEECPDYFVVLFQHANLRHDPELYRLVETAFRRLDTGPQVEA